MISRLQLIGHSLAINEGPGISATRKIQVFSLGAFVYNSCYFWLEVLPSVGTATFGGNCSLLGIAAFGVATLGDANLLHTLLALVAFSCTFLGSG